jgi:thiamine transport system substrate-binding protein
MLTHYSFAQNNTFLWLNRLITVCFTLLLIATNAASHARNSFNINAINAITELRVLTHSAFDLPQPLLDQFEAENHAKLIILKSGDSGEMLNKLILTRSNPIADVVYGIDNSLQGKAITANVLESLSDDALVKNLNTPLKVTLDAPLIAIDYGYVTLNYDIDRLAKLGLSVPKSLDDLTLPAYKNTVVVQNPATSSTGNAFLLATIAGLGEIAAFDWWKKMRLNGLKVTQGWTQAYNIEFSHNGGKYPIVVSYALSPAAEVFYSKNKSAQAPTASLDLKGGVFRQTEGIALIKGGNPKARNLATQFIRLMRSKGVQTRLQTTLWMQPVDKTIKIEPALLLGEKTLSEPKNALELTSKTIMQRNTSWVSHWTKAVLK